MQGWIKVYRKIQEKGYYKKSAYVHLWVHLLLNANHEPKEFMWNNQIIIVKEGQLIAGRKELSKETGIPETTIERILDYLEKDKQIGQQKTTKFRLITVLNWKEYQGSGQQTDNKRTTDGHKQECKNDKNINYISLDEQIKPFESQYAPSLITDFKLYWDETNLKGTPLWKTKKTWDIKKRLERWKRNGEKFDHRFEQKKELSKVEEKPTQRNYEEARVDSGFSGIGSILKK
jgi:hypothetical protein